MIGMTDAEQPTDYYRSWTGQLEYWLLEFFLSACKPPRFPLPLVFFGAKASIDNYLHHGAYSPFMTWPWPKQSPLWSWDERHAYQTAMTHKQGWPGNPPIGAVPFSDARLATQGMSGFVVYGEMYIDELSEDD